MFWYQKYINDEQTEFLQKGYDIKNPLKSDKEFIHEKSQQHEN